MIVLTSDQVRRWDAYTIEQEPITSVELMERAAMACFSWIMENYPSANKVAVFCGTGNNGGDGLAIARLLIEKGIHVSVYICGEPNKGSADFKINLERLTALHTKPFYIQELSAAEAISVDDELVVDAIFGTGLNRPATGIQAAVIDKLNSLEANLISIDISSGLFSDRSSKGNPVTRAKHTLSFQCYKPAFLFAENEDYNGEVHVLDIGLHPGYLVTEKPYASLSDPEHISKLIKPRKNHSHKGNYGHALLVGGSQGKMGAMILAASACLRSGTGLLTVHVPATGNDILQSSVPEAMTSTDPLENTDLQKYSAIGAGPGWGISARSQEQLAHLLQDYRKPVVLDADALNCIALNKDLLGHIPPGSILTPHPKEFERLFGTTADDFVRMALALEQAARYEIHIILKGHYTAIAGADGSLSFNSTGNPGMAKGGSGDVLTGILTGLVAQQYAPLEACELGVYLHGLAGDIAADEISREAMVAGDLVKCLGKAFRHLKTALNH